MSFNKAFISTGGVFPGYLPLDSDSFIRRKRLASEAPETNKFGGIYFGYAQKDLSLLLGFVFCVCGKKLGFRGGWWFLHYSHFLSPATGTGHQPRRPPATATATGHARPRRPPATGHRPRPPATAGHRPPVTGHRPPATPTDRSAATGPTDSATGHKPLRAPARPRMVVMLI